MNIKKEKFRKAAEKYVAQMLESDPSGYFTNYLLVVGEYEIRKPENIYVEFLLGTPVLIKGVYEVTKIFNERENKSNEYVVQVNVIGKMKKISSQIIM